VDAPWYVRNVDIQRDLKFTTATEGIKQSAVKIFQKAESSANQLLQEAVNYDPKFFFLFQIEDNSGPTSQEEDNNSPQTFPPGDENFIFKIWVESFRSYPGANWALTALLALSPALTK